MARVAGLVVAISLSTWFWPLAEAVPPPKAFRRMPAAQAPSGPAQTALNDTPCVAGFAGPYPCLDIDLAAFMPIASIGGGRANDVWGWTDPLTGKEYALLGRTNGTSFVDISDPEHPIYLGNLPTHSTTSVWRSIKVYADHAFIGSEANGHGMQVFDLTQLRTVPSPPVTFTATAHYSGFAKTHTLAVNEETGFIYAAGSNTCGKGLHIVDVRTPTAPTFAGCFSADGYNHETQCVVYRGPDVDHQEKEVCFSSNTDTLTIVDVTDTAAPVQISRTKYTGRAYTHQGWLTEDQAYFLLNDEKDETKFDIPTRTYIWDLADLDAPTVIGTYDGPTGAIDHNLYIRGGHAFESNYRAGLRVLDIGDIDSANLREVAFFDVYPEDDLPKFSGTWSNYPFFASGVVIVSGMEQGLFILRPNIGPPLPQFALTVSTAGTGSGSIASQPAGITCGADCADDFLDGTAVALTAVPGPGSVFAGWSGDPDCADGALAMTANLSCVATFSLAPDLVVSALSAPAFGGAGTTILVRDTVANQGAAMAAASTTTVWLSSDRVMDASDVALGVRDVAEVAAGATNQGDSLVTIPAGTATGTYYILAMADGNAVVAETSEANNLRYKVIKIGPDLRVTALSAPTSAAAGSTVVVTDTTSNQANASPAGPSATHFYLSTNSSLDPTDVPLGERAVGELDAGATSAGSKSLTIPAGTPPGSYYVIAQADGGSTVVERNENNNIRSRAITVTP